MKRNRDEKRETISQAKSKNKKAERSRSNFQTSSTNSDFNHSNEMEIMIRGA
ncbi:hypothetical protein [Lactobacillus johnsonii]|uniref:hypothetical protein n=1 Tax=Lactobacillus johnsonii TaxID=33959 RepID=UPI0013C2E3D1|nr:hypothetical protein [Lactobacillus johnsonii]